MARVELTTTIIDIDGAPVPMNDENEGDGYALECGNDVFVLIKNEGAVDTVATLASTATVNGLAVENAVVTVQASESKMIGPVKPGLFSQSTARAHLDLSEILNVTVGVFKLP